MTIRAVVDAVGHYLPERVVPNSHFESFLDTSDEWIRTRSGIESRRFAAEDQTTSDLAVLAAEEALQKAGISAEELDGVLVATSTPDLTFPSVATMVQSRIGMTRGFALMSRQFVQVSSMPWPMPTRSSSQVRPKSYW